MGRQPSTQRMMRAALVTSYGAVPEVRDVPLPSADDESIPVRIIAAALNPIDGLITSGQWYGGNPELPFVPGREGVGTVLEAAGAWQAGSLVYVRAPGAAPGTMAEVVRTSPAMLVAVPEILDPVVIAAVGFAGTTAALALARGGLRRGERVAVLGATGSVGRAAVQLAVASGAARVVAVGRRSTDLAPGAYGTTVVSVASDGLGGDDEQARITALTEAITEAADGPVDLVIDPVWGFPAAAALRAMSDGARLVNLGSGGGSALALPSELLRAKGLEIRGYSGVHVDPGAFAEAAAGVFAHVAAGRLTLPVERFSLDRVGAAWERAASPPRVKVVVDLSETD